MKLQVNLPILVKTRVCGIGAAIAVKIKCEQRIVITYFAKNRPYHYVHVINRFELSSSKKADDALTTRHERHGLYKYYKMFYQRNI